MSAIDTDAGDEQRAPHGSSKRSVIAGAVVGALVIGGLIGGLVTTVVTSSSVTSAACVASSVIDKDLPSVVTIGVRHGTSGGTGSGEVIRSDGYILTNNHVVALAAQGGTISVTFADGKEVPATLVGRDPQTDIAVIKVNGQSPLQPIPFGSSSSLKEGQPVVALGAPLGLSNTATSGIVSALDRTIQVPGEGDQTALLIDAIQTDAAINPGNSGGALVDCDGNLVGVPSAGASVPNESGGSSSGNVGLGFAIPIAVAQTVSNELISTGTVTHSYFGIQAVPIPAAVAQAEGVPQGLYVQQTVPGGPAASAGLQAGDIITTIDGQPATSTTQLQEIALTKPPGTRVQLGRERQGKAAIATVVLGRQP